MINNLFFVYYIHDMTASIYVIHTYFCQLLIQMLKLKLQLQKYNMKIKLHIFDVSKVVIINSFNRYL